MSNNSTSKNSQDRNSVSGNPFDCNIDCKSFEQRVHQRLDQRLALGGDRWLTEHAAKCPPCDAMMQEYCGLERGLEYRTTSGGSPTEDWVGSPAPLFPAPLLKVWENLSPQSSNSNRFQWKKMGVVFVSVAAALFFVFSVFQFGNELKRWGDVQPQSLVSSNSVSNSNRPSVIGVGRLGFRVPRLENGVAALNSDFTPRSWVRWSESLETLNPYWQYTSELPGVRPMQCSVNLTIDLLQRSLADPEPPQPNLGSFPERAAFASAWQAI